MAASRWLPTALGGCGILGLLVNAPATPASPITPSGLSALGPDAPFAREPSAPAHALKLHTTRSSASGRPSALPAPDEDCEPCAEAQTASALALPVPLMPASESPGGEADELSVTAEHVDYDENAHRLVASGRVQARYRDIEIEADAMEVDTLAQRGRLEGNVRARSPLFDLRAERGEFDALAQSASLERFKGRWAGRAQIAGRRLEMSPTLITLLDGTATPCLSADPDLKLRAHRLSFYPQATTLNLAAEDAAVQIFDRDVLPLPSFSSTVKHEREALDLSFLPRFGFDAYYGFLTSTRLGFSLGERSRGAIPITFSTGRGWSLGAEHALALGEGHLNNTVLWETPWAGGRGGVRALNNFRLPTPGGGRAELALDYRTDLNNLSVHRLPEASWESASLGAYGWSLRPEVRAGYLWEETSDNRSARARLALPVASPVYTPWSGYQTWASVQPFAHRYDTDFYAGVLAAWNHRQSPWPDLALTETLEFNRITGETPFLFDRQYDTERLRLAVDKVWGPRFLTNATVAFSRINQRGDFALEDIHLTGMYRWNCFATGLTLRPLVWGVDLRFELLNF